MKKLLGTMVIATSLVNFLAAIQTISAQTTKKDLLPASQIRDYLRQANGLERISDAVGDVQLTESEESWGGAYDLESLILQSDLVVYGKLSQRESRLRDSGSDIETTYTLFAADVVKGSATGAINGAIKFTDRGGSVRLDNGHTATIKTPAWDNLNLNESYILFLKRQGDHYALAGGSEGAFRVDAQDDSLHTFDTEKVRLAPEIRTSINGMTRRTLFIRIRELSEKQEENSSKAAIPN